MMNRTCASVNLLVGSVLLIRGIIQNYIVRFKYTVVVGVVLKVRLDTRCESETFGGFVSNFHRNLFYPLSAVKMETF